MSTNKKSQHYIPKFYLRNFSYYQNKRQIGIFNISNGRFFDTAPIKSQGSKDFFYGKDGKIEDILSKIEGKFAKYLRKLILFKDVPKRNTKEHIHILEFVMLSDLRNPIIINYSKQTRTGLKQKLEELHPGKNIEEGLKREVTHDEAVSLALGGIKEAVTNTVDLGFKLLINKTSTPFITSDYPIVKYNQLLEDKKHQGGKTGYGSKGLQIIVPINPEMILFFYDSGIYKVGFRKWNFLEIVNKNDVDQLNLLQLLNCQSTLFFNEKALKPYVQNLYEKSLRYKKANILEQKVYKAIDYEISKSNYISFGTSDCEIALKIPGIKYISGMKNIKLPNSMAIMRPKPEMIRRFKK